MERTYDYENLALGFSDYADSRIEVVLSDFNLSEKYVFVTLTDPTSGVSEDVCLWNGTPALRWKFDAYRKLFFQLTGSKALRPSLEAMKTSKKAFEVFINASGDVSGPNALKEST